MVTDSGKVTVAFAVGSSVVSLMMWMGGIQFYGEMIGLISLLT